MEEELRKSRDELELRVREKTADVLRLAAAVDKSAEATVITDPSWLVQYANPAFFQLTGYRSDEVIGREMTFLRSKEEDQSIYEMNRRAAIDGTPKTSRHVIKTKDGTVPVEALISSVRNDSGAITNFVFLWRNISEQLSLEEQLRQAHKMQAIGTLSGGIAHDFNNILAAIIGFTEMVLDDVADNRHVQHKMEQVLKASFRGRDLVKQILAFSRKTAVERKEISLTPLLKETYALLRSSLPSTIQMPLVITTGDDYVVANPTQVQQVIMNLATNAAHAMRDQGGQLTIKLSSVTFPQGSLPDPDMEPGTYVKLTVQDTGVGMTRDVRQRIFEPFFTTKRPGEGTGMGLAVVYGVVKDHEGTVTVQSEPEQGSTFDVFLPQVQRPDTKKEEATVSVLPTGTERILFVDDEELLVEMARGMLESLGYHVAVAANGTDAWNLFRENPSRFDLVITDQTMPDMTGLTLARKMLEVRAGLPIILSTGYSETVSAEKAKEVGIREFVMKPVVRKELAQTVRRVLDERTAGA
jgi:PAS domain S-box-containing protein